jgi:(S)-2-hydroxyglutarate dehydrogenase
MPAPPARCDLAIVGGGILGLAVARELSRRRPRARICVLEREDRLAAHQSGHSSGVIHAGIYYRPGSLKARLCVQGARALYDYCEQRGIAHERCGKLVLACEQRELEPLAELERHGRANGVEGLRWLQAGEIEAVEPHARGLAGLHSPNTGVVDFAEVTRALAAELLSAGGEVHAGCEVRGVGPGRRSLILEHSQGETEATGWRSRREPAPTRGSCPSVAPTCGCALNTTSWCAGWSTPPRTRRCPFSACT